MDELNELPQGWKWVRLGDVAKQDRLIVEPYSELSNNLPYLGLEHIESNSGKILKDIQEKIEDEGKSTTFYFNENHILYGKLRPYLNKVALPNFEGRCTTELMPFLPKDNVNREFIAWILKRDETISFVMQEATGSRMPRADIDKLLNLIIPLPPFPEQQRLATLLTAKLSLIEQAKEKITAQLQAAQELTAAYLREVFESEEAKGWEWVKLGDIAIKISKGESPEWQGFSYTNTGIIFIRSENIQWGSFSDIKKTFIPLEFHNKLTRSKVTSGDILINLVGASIGRVCKCPDNIENANINQAVAVISLSNYNSDFLVNFILTNKIQEHFKDVQVDVARPNISLTNLRDLPIPSISTDKQKQLANYLSEKLATVEQLKTTLQTQLDSINQLPAALLKQAFSGRL